MHERARRSELVHAMLSTLPEGTRDKLEHLAHHDPTVAAAFAMVARGDAPVVALAAALIAQTESAAEMLKRVVEAESRSVPAAYALKG